MLEEILNSKNTIATYAIETKPPTLSSLSGGSCRKKTQDYKTIWRNFCASKQIIKKIILQWLLPQMKLGIYFYQKQWQIITNGMCTVFEDLLIFN